MKPIKLTTEQKAEILAARDQIKDLWAASEAKLAEAREMADEAEALNSKYRNYELTGDIRDTAKMVEAQAWARQATLLEERSKITQEKAKELERGIEAKLSAAGNTVKSICAEIRERVEEAQIEALEPFYFERGRAFNVVCESDFRQAFLNWTTRDVFNGIRSLHGRQSAINEAIDNLLSFGLPSRFGCPLFQSSVDKADVS